MIYFQFSTACLYSFQILNRKVSCLACTENFFTSILFRQCTLCICIHNVLHNCSLYGVGAVNNTFGFVSM